MNVYTYPLWVSIYKGEGRILIIPLIKHVGGYLIDSDWFVNIQDVEDYVSIGKGVTRGVDFIKSSPRSTRTSKESELKASWKKNTKYKSWISFWKNNHLANLKLFEDGHYEVHSAEKSEKMRGGYAGSIKKISLSSGAAMEEIGKAVIEVLEAAEEYYRDKKVLMDDYPVKQIELPDGIPLSVKCPRDKHFSDYGDGHAAEIYQCYSYLPQEGSDSSADFFIGMAAELDCDLAMENIRSIWEEYYGKAEYFEMQEVDYGIFKLRAEMKNKEVHKISYLIQRSEDELLECSMEVHQPNRRKKLDEKLVNLFEEFVLNCNWKSFYPSVGRV